MIKIKFVLINFAIFLSLVSCVVKKNSDNKNMKMKVVGHCKDGVDCDISAVYFAQTHVQEPTYKYFTLVSNRETLIKVNITSPSQSASPEVTATLSLDGKDLTLNLEGPDHLPSHFFPEFGRTNHSFADSFTSYIPKAWMKPGLSILIKAGDAEIEYNNLKIGAPHKVNMTMFDVHYFIDTNSDYANGWKEELEAKWPVSKLTVQRIPKVLFEELVIPPRAEKPAVRVQSKDDYKVQTGINFDGEQAAALQWKSALKAATGTAGRHTLYYVNIYGVHSGGQAGGFGGVGNGTSVGILNHELGHALSLPHWGGSATYPYRGHMYGISYDTSSTDVHVGPVWGFDITKKVFIPPTIQPNAVGGKIGVYKKDPMQGGGKGDQEKGFEMRHFSDYSVYKMENYLEKHIVLWNQDLNSYVTWNNDTKDYTKIIQNNGVSYPIERDTSVISIMAAVSGTSQDINMVYPPIGPYTAGIIKLFDPSVAEDRDQAKSHFCPKNGCDVSLRVTQNGAVNTYLLAASWETDKDPLKGDSMMTKAINLPARDGNVTKAELLLTPNAEDDGLPSNPQILYSWPQEQ